MIGTCRRALPGGDRWSAMPDRRGLPRISIVTPSFNQGPFLERTIVSVLDQKYANAEYIIIDGGSRDQSVEIIQKYQRHLAYWVSEPDGGQSSAINKGFARASGSILTWLNSDDCYLPGTLDYVAEAATAHPETDIFVGAGEMVDEKGQVLCRVTPQPLITLDTLYRWQQGADFLQPSCFFRDRAWHAVGPLDETIHIAFDVDLWMRMAKAGSAFLSLDRLLSRALAHRDAKTTAFVNLMCVDFAIVAIRHGGAHVVRRSLEDLAIRLSWAEPNLNKIVEHPVVKLIRPLVSLLIKPAVRRRDTVPRWLKE